MARTKDILIVLFVSEYNNLYPHTLTVCPQAKNPHALRKKYERETLEPKVPPGTSAHLSQLLSGLLRKEPGARLSYGECSLNIG